MISWIALFRGINVGGNNKLPMAGLRELVSELGFGHPRTYIQSGNLVFESAEQRADRVEAMLAAAVDERFGFHPVILIRSPEQLRSALAANPYASKVKEGRELHFYFLDGACDNYDETALRELAVGAEEFTLKDDIFYLYAPEGVGRSKLAEKLPKYLPRRHTARNLNSVRAMVELADQAQHSG